MTNPIMFQAYQTFAEFNQTDLAGLFLYPQSVWAGFIPLVLFALFTIVMLSTYFSQKRTTGSGDFFASFAVAGFFTAIITFIMALIEGLINEIVLTTVIIIAIIGVILLYSTRD